jgi:hypothetical protein
MLSAAYLESTFALNVLHELAHSFPLQFLSVVLQGFADSKNRFIFIDIGAFVKQIYGGTCSGSTLYHFLGDSETNLLKSASFEGNGAEMSFVILGDKAYPLKTYIMKPVARKEMSCEERIFNCTLSQARRCFECAFGILTEKW